MGTGTASIAAPGEPQEAAHQHRSPLSVQLPAGQFLGAPTIPVTALRLRLPPEGRRSGKKGKDLTKEKMLEPDTALWRASSEPGI